MQRKLFDWADLTDKEKNKQISYKTTKLNSLQHFHADVMSGLTLSTSLFMRKNRYSKLRGITPLNSSVKLSNSDGPIEKEKGNLLNPVGKLSNDVSGIRRKK